MGPPESLGTGGIKILGRGNITPGPVTFHFSDDAPDVVFGVAQVHQLALIRGLENGVAHLLAVGEQTETSIPLCGFHGSVRQPCMTALGTDKIIVLGAH
jgi:hypothetical protein